MILNFANILAEEAVSVATAGEAVAADSTATATAAAPMGGEMITTLVMMVAMVAIFYFLLIRPQRKKDKQVKQMLDSLKVSDRICTIGGIYGTVTGIKDDVITLSVGRQNMEMKVARWAIRSVEEVSIENDAEALN